MANVPTNMFTPTAVFTVVDYYLWNTNRRVYIWLHCRIIISVNWNRMFVRTRWSINCVLSVVCFERSCFDIWTICRYVFVTEVTQPSGQLENLILETRDNHIRLQSIWTRTYHDGFISHFYSNQQDSFRNNNPYILIIKKTNWYSSNSQRN